MLWISVHLFSCFTSSSCCLFHKKQRSINYNPPAAPFFLHPLDAFELRHPSMCCIEINFGIAGRRKEEIRRHKLAIRNIYV